MKRLEEITRKWSIKFFFSEQIPVELTDEFQKEIEQYAREVAQASLEKAGGKWNNVKDKMPLAYKTGNWDGKKSDPVLVMGEDDKYRVATYYEGYMDNTHFQEFYDEREDLISEEVTHWITIPDFHSITNNITLL